MTSSFLSRHAHNAVFSVDPLTYRAPETPVVPPEAMQVFVSGQGILIRNGERPQACFPQGSGIFSSSPSSEYLGHRGSVPYYAIWIPEEEPLPKGITISRVRDLHGRIPDEDLAIASYAARILGWSQASRFCGRCGHPNEPVPTERARRCPSCGLVVYPRVSPAIIVRITRGDEILLARSPRFPAGMYSVIAGFVEPGETLEQAVHREVREEVGISVRNIRYFASEPWPFPDSLMIGFVAEHASGEIAIDNREIASAGWFSRDALPPLPAPNMSISRALIDDWITAAEDRNQENPGGCPDFRRKKARYTP